MKPAIERVDISTEELEALLERVRGVLTAEDYRKLAAAVHTLTYVTELLENRETTAAGLTPTVVSIEHGKDRAGSKGSRS